MAGSVWLPPVPAYAPARYHTVPGCRFPCSDEIAASPHNHLRGGPPPDDLPPAACMPHKSFHTADPGLPPPETDAVHRPGPEHPQKRTAAELPMPHTVL